MTKRRFPPPWTVDEMNDVCFIVRDKNGQQLGYFYYEVEPGRRTAAYMLTKDEARPRLTARSSKRFAVRRPGRASTKPSTTRFILSNSRSLFASRMAFSAMDVTDHLSSHPPTSPSHPPTSRRKFLASCRRFMLLPPSVLVVLFSPCARNLFGWA
jgi:hypothetical protein